MIKSWTPDNVYMAYEEVSDFIFVYSFPLHFLHSKYLAGDIYVYFCVALRVLAHSKHSAADSPLDSPTPAAPVS